MLPKLDTPATYRISVHGFMPPAWSARLGGLTIRTIDQQDGEKVTILSGQLQDQAALIGVINALYDRHLPLLSVEYLENE